MDNDTMGDTLRSQFANPTEANVILVFFEKGVVSG